MSGVNAFQFGAFQQTVGKVAFQLLVVTTLFGGKTEEQIDGKRWKEGYVQNPSEWQKHMAAVNLGRLGGNVGGKARAASLSSKQMINIASRAAQARWK